MAQLSLSGKVIDTQTGTTLPGATISLNNEVFITTNAQGAYQFRNIRPGNYTLKVSYIGYKQLLQTVAVNGNTSQDLKLTSGNTMTEEVTVSSTRASDKSPTAFTNLNKKDIEKNNSGRGFEFLLEQTPSTVVSSNAGAGVGYTSVRIRGSDGTRTNVTINGIPMNDAESQGSFMVNLPDFASSIDNIQVQRGVGTSTNGAGAFGASINIQTTTRRDSAYAELNNSAGSYGTIKNTVSIGTGLLGGHFTVDGRLSRINSDGYIDRAFSKMKSYFLSGAYYGQKDVLRVNVFSGDQQTYQAWNGVPEEEVRKGNYRYNELGYMEKAKDYYDNQTDNYIQNYYQLLYNRQLTDKLSFSGALHYTKGAGYYEEFKNNEPFTKYGITPVVIGGVTVANTDLVRRLWLDNHFYGLTYNLDYNPSTKLNLKLGGGYNEYKGDHFSNIRWTQQSTTIFPNHEYSRDHAKKTDFNTFLRAEFHPAENILIYGDAQYRRINYSFLGFDRNLNNIQQAVNLNFFNPKAGITVSLNSNSDVYASVAVANREPNRNDFTNSSPDSRPKSERLTDFELGYRYNQTNFSASINGYYMKYKNQLVLTGALNDVGSSIRTNIDDSYRAGLEGNARIRVAKPLTWLINATVSANKVKGFRQFLYNYDTDALEMTQYGTTNIAYSPSLIAGSTLSWAAIKNGEIALIGKYVGRQYLDNTSTKSRSLDDYLITDVRLNYNFAFKGVKNVGVGLLVNNVFSKRYWSDGATYPGISGGVVENYNYFFPQAPINFLASLNVKF
ncbi:TonB-dependent receptor [Mucilaginibacter myungsuensis]|uniref:TonB-dependent receptor n=2 Tax=Mucilaginibacter myungsuensis TaxID=649104 RepID=A0A929PW07_9SPHI|nr:TonB-dependent receptor [Mucilaginibacter myungsuensis]MBE9661669.1 TonB-dependent receptor [Mucilaginibacter myungsuensis]MDN3597813.1 TonB-dependent receptor [Mucilaginibacter myungsuensis]